MFLFDSRSFGFAQVGVTFACDLIPHGEMHHCGAESCFFTFLAQMTPYSQKSNILMLSLFLSLSHSLCIGHTLTTCAHRLHLLIERQCECTSSTNESLYYSAIMMISPFCVLHHATEGSAQLHTPQ